MITSRKCGAAELLDESNGAVCDALDIARLTAALRRFADRAAARSAGASARRAIEPYSLQRMSDEYVALYRRLLTTATGTAAGSTTSNTSTEPTVSSATAPIVPTEPTAPIVPTEPTVSITPIVPTASGATSAPS